MRQVEKVFPRGEIKGEWLEWFSCGIQSDDPHHWQKVFVPALVIKKTRHNKQ